MRELHASEYIEMVRREDRIAVIRRNATPYPSARAFAEDIDAALVVLRAEQGLRGVIVDARAPRGRNEEDFESVAKRVQHRLTEIVPRAVLLVRSAVGTLQASRLTGDDPRSIATQNLDEAVNFILEGTSA